jgi:hypothetical protein
VIEIKSSCVSEGRCRLRVVQSKMLKKGERGEINEGTKDITYCNKELQNYTLQSVLFG